MDPADSAGLLWWGGVEATAASGSQPPKTKPWLVRAPCGRDKGRSGHPFVLNSCFILASGWRDLCSMTLCVGCK